MLNHHISFLVSEGDGSVGHTLHLIAYKIIFQGGAALISYLHYNAYAHFIDLRLQYSNVSVRYCISCSYRCTSLTHAAAHPQPPTIVRLDSLSQQPPARQQDAKPSTDGYTTWPPCLRSLKPRWVQKNGSCPCYTRTTAQSGKWR